MRTSQLHLQRSTEAEGLRHSCLRQSPPRNTKARHSAKDNTLQSIACDAPQLTNTEIANLQRWLQTHHALRGNYPFDEISERLESILRDSVIDEDERAELLEWCADLSLDTHPVYDLIDMATRQLHGVLHGIQSDGVVTEEEVYGLRDWLEHFHIFRDAWPFSDALCLVERDSVNEAAMGPYSGDSAVLARTVQ